jgi:hypothetical protein
VLHVRVSGELPWVVFELDVKPGADVREEAAQRLVRHGWPLRELRKEQPSLEDIFVRLTTSDQSDRPDPADRPEELH